ncbi:hypothetical protein NDU88_003809 [Pleurodeles waltl]|uniref:Uncharacterized protein n=1 Tax=Pleurodeles waltl TaxID=8319 RepID=A0AAV7W4J0_PLEWA|nr:hypothetical protein NDU88_003809 [Pleurodeles waltl]
MCIGLITACVLIIVAIVLGMHGKNESETNDASTSKPIIVTELTALKRLEQDERHLHDKKELSSNIFYRLLSEYVETMDAKDCYVCTQIPTSVVEGVTYHSMPLTLLGNMESYQNVKARNKRKIEEKIENKIVEIYREK